MHVILHRLANADQDYCLYYLDHSPFYRSRYYLFERSFGWLSLF
jgi:hypothetical protein